MKCARAMPPARKIVAMIVPGFMGEPFILRSSQCPPVVVGQRYFAFLVLDKVLEKFALLHHRSQVTGRKMLPATCDLRRTVKLKERSLKPCLGREHTLQDQCKAYVRHCCEVVQ